MEHVRLDRVVHRIANCKTIWRWKHKTRVMCFLLANMSRSLHLVPEDVSNWSLWPRCLKNCCIPFTAGRSSIFFIACYTSDKLWECHVPLDDTFKWYREALIRQEASGRIIGLIIGLDGTRFGHQAAVSSTPGFSSSPPCIAQQLNSIQNFHWRYCTLPRNATLICIFSMKVTTPSASV